MREVCLRAAGRAVCGGGLGGTCTWCSSLVDLTPKVTTCCHPPAAAAGILACLSGSTLRILLEFLLPKDGSLVAFGQYALQYGPAVPGLPNFMEVTPAGNSSSGLVWDPEKDTCQQGEFFPSTTCLSSPHSASFFLLPPLPHKTTFCCLLSA